MGNGERCGKLVEGVRNHFNPDEMGVLIKQAITTAEAAQPETGGLFWKCQKDGWKGCGRDF